MRINQLDNLLIKSCKKAELVKIKTKNKDIILCSEFRGFENNKLIFNNFYVMSPDKQRFNKNVYYCIIDIDCIEDIEFSF